MKIAKAAAVFLIDFARNIRLAPGAVCRFYPSCSVYAKEAVEKYGVFFGGARAVWRLARCNPFSKGGYDPVK